MTDGRRAERYQTADYHTAGEPFRIVEDGVPEIPGDDVAARREYAIGSAHIQRIRRLLCHEPRGHADMYGCFLVPPNDAGAQLGVLFWHNDGFSTACGHGTIAVATWAVETGRVPAVADGETEVVIDVPSGRVRAVVRTKAGAVASVAFVNVPGWVMQRSVPVLLPEVSELPEGMSGGPGNLTVDIAFAGAAYACLPAAAVGLRVEPQHYQRLTEVGRAIRRALNDAGAAHHPADQRLSGIYGTILYDELDVTDLSDDIPPGSLWQRNITVFADGQVDRSPCGSGTCARVALLAAENRLADGAVLVHDSIIGTRFLARVLSVASEHGTAAVVPEVVGSAYRIGSASFVVDANDPVVPGFVLR